MALLQARDLFLFQDMTDTEFQLRQSMKLSFRTNMLWKTESNFSVNEYLRFMQLKLVLTWKKIKITSINIIINICYTNLNFHQVLLN